MTRVVKVDSRDKNFTLYIGRAWAGHPESKWHNPFRIHAQCSREECLAKYKQHIRNTPELWTHLYEIDDQVLGCWCCDSDGSGEPRCHGDVLIKLRKEQLDARANLPERSR